MLEMIVICGLAGWRLAYFLVNERGLFNVGGLIRYMAGQRTVERTLDTPNGRVKVPTRIAHWELAKMLECVYCTTFTTSILMLITWHSQWQLVVHFFAIWGVAVVVQKMTDR